MTTSLVRLLQPFYSTGGLLNAGESVGLPAALASQLVTAGTAVLIDDGAGSGVPTSSPFRGQGAGELDSQFEAAGGSSGNLNPSAAIQGVEGAVTIIAGRNVPNSLIGDKAQG
jgi:hypothetical protein